jgi:hypothetical protein
MQLQDKRDQNNTQPETVRSKSQTARRILEAAIDKTIDKNGGIEQFVDKIYTEATQNGEQWAYQEILNRKFGKVKDEVQLNIIPINDLRPDQQELQALEEQFKAKNQPIDTLPDSIKALPDASNAEQNTTNTDNIPDYSITQV